MPYTKLTWGFFQLTAGESLIYFRRKIYNVRNCTAAEDKGLVHEFTEGLEAGGREGHLQGHELAAAEQIEHAHVLPLTVNSLPKNWQRTWKACR